MKVSQVFKGKFFVIIGPSAGAGKTTLVNTLLEKIPQSERITTTTTRAPREGEVDGKDFFFVTREQFESERDENVFVEWSEHLGNYYGTPDNSLDALLNIYSVVFAVLDINGAQQILKKMPDAVTIFIKPDNINDLRKRLEERNSESKEQQEKRLLRAVLEIKTAPLFHHVVINYDGKFEETFLNTFNIVQSYLS